MNRRNVLGTTAAVLSVIIALLVLIFGEGIYWRLHGSEATSSPVAEGMVIVPNVVGKEQMEAVDLLVEQGFEFEVQVDADLIAEEGEPYWVIEQSIPPETQVPDGTKIILSLSSKTN